MKTFEELNLLPAIKQALREENYQTPTPIQAQTIPVALEGRDVLGCAQTGTGKTAAFALPILNRLGQHPRKAGPNQPLVLVLAPTRELAIQIEESFATYGRHLRLRHVLVYGGVSQGNQVRALNRGAHVLVATPGRLIDLMDQGHIELDRLEIFVLDEADRMLDMGFMPALKRIISQLPKQRQSLFFSATMPPKIMELAQQLLTDPFSVTVKPRQSSAERIAQQLFFVERAAKLSLLQKVLGEKQVESAIVFAKTKRGANMLAERLVRGGIQAAVIHGNKSQSARQRALDAFKNRQVKVLVATDIAARGIDIDNISHIVNYDMPVDPESYVHRIGRTGRAGAEGIAITFCTAAELGELREIETLIGKPIPLAPNQIRPWAAEPEPRSRGRTGTASSGRGTSGNRNGSSRNANPMSGNSHKVRSSNGRSQASRQSTRVSSSRPATATAQTGVKPRPVSAAAESTTVARPAAAKAKRPLQRKIRKLTGRTSFGTVR